MTTPKNDFLFRGALDELDPDVAELVRHETARQALKLILIPSESTVPYAVRETLSSAFHNLYAEGYPLESTRHLSEAELLDFGARLSEFRRLADERYYKGTEYANLVEGLARRRAAEVFAANGLTPEQLYVNVQPLSGAPANNAVYTALLSPGDTLMGMDLIEGGHLTHGSPVNRSGKVFNIVSYGIGPATGHIDYERMRALALEHKPKIIIGGYSSYPYQADWAKYREIADEAGAYLLADVAHVSGLIAAGVYPSPVGVADIVTFTTHKTLNGPRGGVIITHDKKLSAKLDRAVFPGEQGGPHINQIAALAVALKLAKTEQFRELQAQTVKNAARLAERLSDRGLTLAFGGTNTHLLNVDCTSIRGADGTTLSGDMAARILDIAGIVLNRQTIPGDTSALRPNGIRMGTPWITQRGFGDDEIDTMADIIADVLDAIEPFNYAGQRRALQRAKVDFDVLMNAQIRVRELAGSVGIDTKVRPDDYPHFYYLDAPLSGPQRVSIQGKRARAFWDFALTSDVHALKPGQSQPTRLLNPAGQELAQGVVTCETDTRFALLLNDNAALVVAWLRSLADGFVRIDNADVYARVPGPVTVTVEGAAEAPAELEPEAGYVLDKAYFIGMNGPQYVGPRGAALPAFSWAEPERDALLSTPLHDLHVALGAKMVPFAGYDMPVWYSSVQEEHLAVRQGAGVFDVAHMGAFDLRGAGAEVFLDTVTSNDVRGLAVGDSHYTYLLDADGIPHDDLMIYRLGDEHFLLVVNASNNDKNWAWLKAVKAGEVLIDPSYPSRKASGAADCILRDLRDRSVGADMRVDIALQGPKSLDVLLALDGLEEDKTAVRKLKWAGITRAHLGGFDLIISRTGYTGERVAYELFVHPDKAAELFKILVDKGATPCGLASRDSLRTEAGLPLYGQELAGPLGLNPADAGFGSYVKLWKPFFIGKAAFAAHEAQRDAEIVRFRMDNKGARPAHLGDPIVDRRGRVVGLVTSCSIDSDGYQLGQAYIKTDFQAEGTAISIYAGSARSKALPLRDLKIGSKAPMPEAAAVLSRFPRRKKS